MEEVEVRRGTKESILGGRICAFCSTEIYHSISINKTSPTINSPTTDSSGNLGRASKTASSASMQSHRYNTRSPQGPLRFPLRSSVNRVCDNLLIPHEETGVRPISRAARECRAPNLSIVSSSTSRLHEILRLSFLLSLQPRFVSHHRLQR